MIAMRYYIVDDEIGAVKTLENIIDSRRIGDVIGFNTDPTKAETEILRLRPDVVLVDLLMTKMDGITMVRSIKTIAPAIQFVMISEVTDKGMVQQAYEAGVEFFINKPINLIEVERVLTNVNEKTKMNSLVSNIRGMFDMDDNIPREPEEESDEKILRTINVLLSAIGMMGEKGTKDIQKLCCLTIKEGGEYNHSILETVSKIMNEPPKNIEQRARRAIKKGLENVANSEIEDFNGDMFNSYGIYVFDFKNIKDEKNRINGTSDIGGRVSISKFIEGVSVYYNNVK